ncbi:uncharacterized protein [Littorina saxatilis]|uniref:uncharacterized protein isoform X2 n=1 Tax=Littorina saxatilis TaxID=31220 RepID=UPI0038B66CC2
MPLSSALFLPLVLFVGVVTFEFSPADEKACSIGRYGTLIMFNGETADVELPCKYRLADFTCGDYRVKVTPGSAVDQEDSHRFSPDTVRVKVVNANTSEFVKIQTSMRQLDKFSENKRSNPWQVKNGSQSVVDFADYDQSRAAAVLRKDGVFSVEFRRAERSVVVTCSDQKFVSEGLPESLCGDETTTDAMNNAMTTLFPGQGNMTDDALVSYIVLNHDNVVQSPTCKDLASKFTRCQDKEQAAMECVAIFADPSQAECLATSNSSLADYFADCLTSVCDNDTSAVEPMNNFISDNCGTVTAAGSIRLVGGLHSREGRVEVFNNGSWGTVCDDYWGVLDARVVCRQLGFNTSAATAYILARFGKGGAGSPIWLDDVHCVGSESRLVNCPADLIGDHDCEHYEDAGVSC